MKKHKQHDETLINKFPNLPIVIFTLAITLILLLTLKNDPKNWGTIADWVGVLGSFLAILFVIYQVKSERKLVQAQMANDKEQNFDQKRPLILPIYKNLDGKHHYKYESTNKDEINEIKSALLDTETRGSSPNETEIQQAILNLLHGENEADFNTYEWPIIELNNPTPNRMINLKILFLHDGIDLKDYFNKSINLSPTSLATFNIIKMDTDEKIQLFPQFKNTLILSNEAEKELKWTDCRFVIYLMTELREKIRLVFKIKNDILVQDPDYPPLYGNNIDEWTDNTYPTFQDTQPSMSIPINDSTQIYVNKFERDPVTLTDKFGQVPDLNGNKQTPEQIENNFKEKFGRTYLEYIKLFYGKNDREALKIVSDEDVPMSQSMLEIQKKLCISDYFTNLLNLCVNLCNHNFSEDNLEKKINDDKKNINDLVSNFEYKDDDSQKNVTELIPKLENAADEFLMKCKENYSSPFEMGDETFKYRDKISDIVFKELQDEILNFRKNNNLDIYGG